MFEFGGISGSRRGLIDGGKAGRTRQGNEWGFGGTYASERHGMVRDIDLYAMPWYEVG